MSVLVGGSLETRRDMIQGTHLAALRIAARRVIQRGSVLACSLISTTRWAGNASAVAKAIRASSLSTIETMMEMSIAKTGRSVSKFIAAHGPKAIREISTRFFATTATALGRIGWAAKSALIEVLKQGNSTSLFCENES